MGLQWSSGGGAPEEREALLGLPTSPAHGSRVFGRRWLVLALFSLLAFMQGLVWNTWGPIQGSARQAYGFSSLDIALLVLWGPIGFLPCFFLMWLMDKKGLRVSMLLTAAFMVIGSGLRCVPVSDVKIKQRLIHSGQLFNGLAGPFVMNAAPFLSTTWFSLDERATATAIASMLSYFGAACAFLVGPLFVPGPNGTAPLISPHGQPGQMRDRIETVLYAEFGVIALIFAASYAYFPMRPPVPPSVAAASRRLSYRNSICKLLRPTSRPRLPTPENTRILIPYTRSVAPASFTGGGSRCRLPFTFRPRRQDNVRFLMIAVAYALPLGVFAGWSGVLDLILAPLHITQVNAGWIGFWSIVGGCVVGIALARFADYIRGMLKLILVLLFSGATLAATWFTLTSLSTVTHLPLTSATLYASCILLGVFLNSTVPIFFELFVETVYPIPEGITCGVVTLLSNIFMGLLLSFLTFYHTELSWLSWSLTGSCLLSLLFILCFRESYDRLYLDVFVSV